MAKPNRELSLEELKILKHQRVLRRPSSKGHGRVTFLLVILFLLFLAFIVVHDLIEPPPPVHTLDRPVQGPIVP